MVPAASPSSPPASPGSTCRPPRRPGPDLTVAVILDPFSASWPSATSGTRSRSARTTGARCSSATRPDLLFVESAWQGNDGPLALTHDERDGRARSSRCATWSPGAASRASRRSSGTRRTRRTTTGSSRPRGCSTRSSPSTPSCIPRLPVATSATTGSALLPFAAQPRDPQPGRACRGGRRHEVAFAGTYFAEKHPERARADGVRARPGARARPAHLSPHAARRPALPRSRGPTGRTSSARCPTSGCSRRTRVQGLPQRQLGDRVADDVRAPALRAVRRADRRCVSGRPRRSIEPFFGAPSTVVETPRRPREALDVLLKRRGRTATASRSWRTAGSSTSTSTPTASTRCCAASAGRRRGRERSDRQRDRADQAPRAARPRPRAGRPRSRTARSSSSWSLHGFTVGRRGRGRAAGVDVVVVPADAVAHPRRLH